ncbi:MAG: hypothetical protein GQ535_12025 [Rhodobacteraceae bacterium]|nr:hypothetical protein [Paracoccaceae bacterium]
MKHIKNALISLFLAAMPMEVAAESIRLPPMQGDTCGTTCTIGFWRNSNLQDISIALAGLENLDAHDGYGTTPLHFAAIVGYTDIISTLIASGANPDVLDQYDKTPLMNALNSETPATVQAFIDAGVSLDFGSPLGYVLKSCACMNSTELVQMLLDGGADIAAPDMYGDHPVFLAAGWSGPAELSAILAARTEWQRAHPAQFLDVQNWRSHTALTIAARWGNTENVRILLTSGADLHLQDTFGNSALHLAARWGRPELVQLLIEAGLDAAVTNTEGQSPFFFAKDNPRLKGADVLIFLQLAEITQ